MIDHTLRITLGIGLIGIVGPYGLGSYIFSHYQRHAYGGIMVRDQIRDSRALYNQYFWGSLFVHGIVSWFAGLVAGLFFVAFFIVITILNVIHAAIVARREKPAADTKPKH
jgi:hypothetical protein